jgi:hypothetical protein
MIDTRISEIDSILKREDCKQDNEIKLFIGDETTNINSTLNSTSKRKLSYKNNQKLNEQLNSIRSNVLELKSKLIVKNKIIEKLKIRKKSANHNLKKQEEEEGETGILNTSQSRYPNKMDYSFMNLRNELDKSKLSILVPRWIPDPIVRKCLTCSTNFGLFTRKHHCRKCGEIFCNNCCSNFDSFLPFYDDKVRICHECFKDK